MAHFSTQVQVYFLWKKYFKEVELRIVCVCLCALVCVRACIRVVISIYFCTLNCLIFASTCGRWCNLTQQVAQLFLPPHSVVPNTHAGLEGSRFQQDKN